MSALLVVEDLQTHFATSQGLLRAVDGVSFSIERGEVMGLVGESGSGKSVTGYSIMRLVPSPGYIASGRILFGGEDLASASADRIRSLRGARIAMIFQDPMMTLNPVLSIGTQMIETVLAHRQVSPSQATRRACEVLEMVGIASPQERLASFPHQLSGGMRQRVVIAIAIVIVSRRRRFMARIVPGASMSSPAVDHLIGRLGAPKGTAEASAPAAAVNRSHVDSQGPVG